MNGVNKTEYVNIGDHNFDGCPQFSADINNNNQDHVINTSCLYKDSNTAYGQQYLPNNNISVNNVKNPYHNTMNNINTMNMIPQSQTGNLNIYVSVYY